jgi:hypothetical protein
MATTPDPAAELKDLFVTSVKQGQALVIDGLASWADLVEKRSLPVGSEATLSDTSSSTKGHHVSRQKSALSSSPVASSQEDALGPLPGTNPPSVSSTADSAAAPSRAQWHPGKEQR